MLEMEEQYMMRQLRETGLNKTVISERTGHDRKTVRKYLLCGEIKCYKPREAREKIIDAYSVYIKGRLGEFPELSSIRLFEEVKELGYTGSYSSVKVFVRSVNRSLGIPAELRYETGPGIQAQADWGDVGNIEVDGETREVHCFTMILGYSRVRYVEFTLDTTTETFIQGHLNAFAFYGGITKEILYDNTKNVVLKRTLRSSDSTWNPLFEDFFRHFGFFPNLCKPGNAKGKGKVERLVRYVKENFYLGRKFNSLQDINNQACQWMAKVNGLPHGTTKVPPCERMKEEKLTPFDKFSQYQIVRTEYRKISRDCYFSYMGNLYSVPWKYAGLQAMLRIQNRKMQVFVNGENICEHVVRIDSGQTVRNSEHFEGLLKEIMGRNRAIHEQRISALKQKAPIVDIRPLVEYDIFMGGGADER